MYLLPSTFSLSLLSAFIIKPQSICQQHKPWLLSHLHHIANPLLASPRCMLLVIWFVNFTSIVIVVEFYILSWPSPVNGEMFRVSEKYETILRASAWKGLHELKRASESCSFTPPFFNSPPFDRLIIIISMFCILSASSAGVKLHVGIPLLRLHPIPPSFGELGSSYSLHAVCLGPSCFSQHSTCS